MKITSVEPLLIDRYLYARIRTDEDLVGIGESGAWAYLEASAAALAKYGEYLVGQDPLNIEHHWQYMYRFAHFRGAAIMGAISAIDIALWDIAGKFFGVPVHRLLGGPTRNKVRAYLHVFGDTKQKLVEGVRDARSRGFTAVGHLTPFLDEEPDLPYFKTHVDKITDAISTVASYREAAGSDVDICIELHRRLTPAEAIVFAEGVAPYHPLFIEDPVPPDNFDAMSLIASRITVPIATGERLHTIHEFEMLLKRGAMQYARVSVCLAGGISHARKIAALAEAHYVNIVPHNPLSPVSTAACLQVAASVPNFAIQEYPLGETEEPKAGIVKTPLQVTNGFLLLPDAPGIGMELAPDAERRFPPVPRRVRTRLHADGSVVDQ